MKALGVATLLVAVLVAPACTSTADAETRAAIDRLRAAPAASGGARRPLLDALRTAPATSKEARGAKDACVAAYAALLDARELIEAAKASRRDADVIAAEKRTSEAADLMPACDAASVALTKRLK